VEQVGIRYVQHIASDSEAKECRSHIRIAEIASSTNRVCLEMWPIVIGPMEANGTESTRLAILTSRASLHMQLEQKRNGLPACCYGLKETVVAARIQRKQAIIHRTL
jgi:hypothetical protein